MPSEICFDETAKTRNYTIGALVVRLKDGKIYKTGSIFEKKQAEEILQKSQQSLDTSI